MAVHLWTWFLEEEQVPYSGVDHLVHGHEFIHASACCQAGKLTFNVKITLILADEDN